MVTVLDEGEGELELQGFEDWSASNYRELML